MMFVSKGNLLDLFLLCTFCNDLFALPLGVVGDVLSVIVASREISSEIRRDILRPPHNT